MVVLRRYMAVVSGVALTLFVSPAAASCGDRPGTPTNVTATSFFRGMIQVEWTNTASESPLWWDYEVFENGQRVPQRAGLPPIANGMQGWRLENNFLPGPGVWGCYRLRARTGPGTQGCV